MLNILLLFLELPPPVLITLIVALACLTLMLVLLVAFVPGMSEKIVALIKVVQGK